jgi:hypothetical protein
MCTTTGSRARRSVCFARRPSTASASRTAADTAPTRSPSRSSVRRRPRCQALGARAERDRRGGRIDRAPLCYYQLVGDSAATIARTVNAGVEGFPNTPRTGSGGCDHADEDPDLAVEILEEASGRPSCVGVEVGSSIGGVRLDVSRFEPCLPRRRARAPARTARLWARATRGLIPLNTCVGGSLSPLQEAIALQATAGWP